MTSVVYICTTLGSQQLLIHHGFNIYLSTISLSFSSVPSGPPEGLVTLTTSTDSFAMSWDPPPKDQQNGRIENYEVEYREEDSSTVVNDTTHYTMYTAEDLTTDRVYQFRVAATTVNGTGPFSEWSEVVTIPTGNGGL